MSFIVPSVNNVIIIDSNFILLPFQFKIDYLKEIQHNLEGKTQFIIFKQVLDELEAKKNREKNATKFQRLLKSGLSYLESNKQLFTISFVEEVKSKNETTDDFLIRMSNDLKSDKTRLFIATNDAELKKKAKALSIGRIFLRQKKFISFEIS